MKIWTMIKKVHEYTVLEFSNLENHRFDNKLHYIGPSFREKKLDTSEGLPRPNRKPSELL